MGDAGSDYAGNYIGIALACGFPLRVITNNQELSHEIITSYIGLRLQPSHRLWWQWRR
jgi:hypothetical protein